MKKLMVIGLVCLFGCSDARTAASRARGEDHRIRLWSGGKAVCEWVSKGHVISAEGSSLIGFMDKETGLYVKLRGTISVEEAPKE